MVDFLYLFKDINFQKGFLLVAAFILLMVLLNVAYKLSKKDDGGPPPIIAPCPDFWDLSGTYCINTNGQNIGHQGGAEHSLWKTTTNIECDDNQGNPYNIGSPINCTNMNLKTIPIGTMSRGAKTNELVGGGIKNGYVQDIRRRRSKYSRKTWADKYGFAWDGLKTKW